MNTISFDVCVPLASKFSSTFSISPFGRFADTLFALSNVFEPDPAPFSSIFESSSFGWDLSSSDGCVYEKNINYFTEEMVIFNARNRFI